MSGQEVRLLDISADTRRHLSFDELHGFAEAADFAGHLNNMLERYYGTAGQSFVCHLMRQKGGVETVRRYFDVMKRVMLDGVPACGSFETRASRRFAIIAAAGELATIYGITGWPEGAATFAAKEVFLEWLERREDVDHEKFTIEDLGLAIQRIINFEQSMESQIWTKGSPPVATPVGFRTDNLLYLPATTWEGLCPSGDIQDLARALKREGVLKAGDGKNLQSKYPKAFGMAEARGYAFKIDALKKWPERSERAVAPKMADLISDLSDAEISDTEPSAPPTPEPFLRLVPKTDPTIPTVPT
jgi:hypothetical protein